MAETLTAVGRTLDLLDQDRCPAEPVEVDGYVRIGASVPPATTLGARTMRTGFYPVLYETFRPWGLRLASGLAAPGRDGDRAALVKRLDLVEGATVLDVACGPGNFTAFLGEVVGDSGLAVGLDASDSMLGKAVASNSSSRSAYVLGDAENLPFRSRSFDAVSCLAALYLMNDPYAAIRDAVRVLRPGGRIAILTTYSGSDPVTRLATVGIELATGVRRFHRDDITSALRRHGMVDVEQDLQGLTQTVWARKPDTR